MSDRTLLCGGVRAGKTTKAIEYCREHKCLYVVPNDAQKRFISRQYPDIEVKTWHEMLGTRSEGIKSRNLVIDNIDTILNQEMYRHRIMYMTTSDYPENTYIPKEYVDKIKEHYGADASRIMGKWFDICDEGNNE